MGRSEVSLSPRPSGSGRSDDWFMPDPLQVLSTSSNASQFRNRLNGSTVAAVVGGFGGGGVNLVTLSGDPGVGSATGAPTSSIAGNGAGVGQICRATNGPLVWMNIKKSGVGYLAGQDDYAVTNVYAIGAYTGGAGAQTLDSGLQVTKDGGIMIASGRGGLGFVRTGLNILQLAVIAVDLGAVTLYPIANGGTYDETKLNKQQFIFQSATALTEASVTAYLNNVPVKTLFWGPGATGVTVPDLSTASTGFVPQIINGANVTFQLRIPAGFHVSHGPTVADTY